MVTDFVDVARHCFKKGGFASADDEGQEQGGDFLVGYKNLLFHIGSDYQVGVPWDDFDGVGSGGDIVRGSLFASIRLANAEPKLMIQTALEAASHMNAAVRGPYVILHT